MIKLFDPYVGNDERKNVISVLKSHYWASGSGDGNVKNFENKFCQYINSKSCVAVNSGTAALNLALSIFDIKDKEVILPSLSFVSTAHSVILNGGKPVFVDIDPYTLCISPEKIEEKISNKTRLILPVHFGGMSSNLDKIKKIAKKNNLKLIEDAAHATGTTYKNQKIGSHGDLTCFSFHPVKNLAMPTGGLISINTKNHTKIKNELDSKRWCGIINRKGFDYDVDKVGNNYYMNEFSASIGLSQIKKLKHILKRKKVIAKRYSTELRLEKIMPFNHECSYHLYWIFVDNQINFIKYMKSNKVEVGIHYKPIHKMSFYDKKINLPITEKTGQHIISIPIHPNLTDNNVTKIIKIINSYEKNNSSKIHDSIPL